MPRELKLDSIGFQTFGNQTVMSIPRDLAVLLVRMYVVTYGSFGDDLLGIYTKKSIGNSGAITFQSLTPPKHIFQPRLNGCQFRPKGKLGINQSKVEIFPFEYDGQQCPDAFFGAWERILGVGNDINNFRKTTEGEALFQEMLRNIVIGHGNSFHEMVEFANHPLIAESNANGWYGLGSAEEWPDYVDQQQVGYGRMTLVDDLKLDGLSNYNVDIESYLDASGNWTGDIFAFLDSLIRARPTAFKLAERSAGKIKGIIEVDEVTFDELGTQMLSLYPTIPDMFYLFVNGENGRMKLDNHFYYKGYVIFCQDKWTAFDELTGTMTRRAMLEYPGVWGLLYDVAEVNEYSGAGILVQQLADITLKGRIDFLSQWKYGNVILDTNFVVNASKTFTPA